MDDLLKHLNILSNRDFPYYMVDQKIEENQTEKVYTIICKNEEYSSDKISLAIHIPTTNNQKKQILITLDSERMFNPTQGILTPMEMQALMRKQVGENIVEYQMSSTIEKALLMFTTDKFFNNELLNYLAKLDSSKLDNEEIEDDG